MGSSDSDGDGEPIIAHHLFIINPWKKDVQAYGESYKIACDDVMCYACGKDPCYGKSSEDKKAVRNFVMMQSSEGGVGDTASRGSLIIDIFYFFPIISKVQPSIGSQNSQ
jgi:hypothetical protein